MIGVIAVDDLLEVMLPEEWRIRVQRYPQEERTHRTPPDSGRP
jgi:hypothetical protein